MAKKKIIDILPPKARISAEKKLNVSRTVVLKIKKEAEKPKTDGQKWVRRSGNLKDFKFFSIPVFLRQKAVFLLPLAALIGIYFLSNFFSTATVEIWPQTEQISFDAKVNLDKKIKQLDVRASFMPAETIEKEKTVSSNFPASGKASKETKAEGVITVYNNYSPSYQVLVATTRFVSTEGKVFRTLEKVMIPGSTQENGKLKAGEINIRVAADQPGKEYNIGPDTFSIPGFAGTDRYTKFYAKSFQPFTGGSSETVSEVTAADLNKAEDVLVQQAKSETENLLRSDLQAEGVSSVFNFLDGGIQTEITEKFSSVKAGGEAQEFTYQVKAKSKTLLFKKEDIKKFVENYILSRIPQGKKIYEPSLQINYFSEQVNFDSGTSLLALKISADIYSDLDEKAIKNNISQKSLSEIKIFLSNQPEIGNVLVRIWPFWLAKAPKNTERINIKTKF